MELRVITRPDSLALDASLHPPDLANVGVGKRVAIDVRCDELEEAIHDARVAGDGASPARWLELPGERPRLLLARVPAKGAGERSLLAFRAQARVDAEHLPLRGRRPERLHE